MAVNPEVEDAGDEDDEADDSVLQENSTTVKRRKLAKGAEYLKCAFCGASEKDAAAWAMWGRRVPV